MSDNLTPKAILPVTHAILLVKMGEGDPQPIAAVEFREDGHMQTKGSVAAHCTDFIKAAALVATQSPSFMQELHVALLNPATPSPTNPS